MPSPTRRLLPGATWGRDPPTTTPLDGTPGDHRVARDAPGPGRVESHEHEQLERDRERLAEASEGMEDAGDLGPDERLPAARAEQRRMEEHGLDAAAVQVGGPAVRCHAGDPRLVLAMRLGVERRDGRRLDAREAAARRPGAEEPHRRPPGAKQRAARLGGVAAGLLVAIRPPGAAEREDGRDDGLVPAGLGRERARSPVRERRRAAGFGAGRAARRPTRLRRERDGEQARGEAKHGSPARERREGRHRGASPAHRGIVPHEREHQTRRHQRSPAAREPQRLDDAAALCIQIGRRWPEIGRIDATNALRCDGPTLCFQPYAEVAACGDSARTSSTASRSSRTG